MTNTVSSFWLLYSDNIRELKKVYEYLAGKENQYITMHEILTSVEYNDVFGVVTMWTHSPWVAHELDVISILNNVSSQVKYAVEVSELNSDTFYRYDPEGKLAARPDRFVSIIEDNVDIDTLPDPLKNSENIRKGGVDWFHHTELDGYELPDCVNVLECEFVDLEHIQEVSNIHAQIQEQIANLTKEATA